MHVQHFFDPRTSSLTYVVSEGIDALVIDPVLDYDPRAGRTFTESIEAVERYLDREGLTLHYVLETHPHADHLSAGAELRRRRGARIAIGAGITQVQKRWRDLLNLGEDFPTDGRQFDLLLADGQRVKAGSLEVEALLTEGHTPASLTYRIGDALFVGDLIFMPDAGTARTDFPGGSAVQMFESIQRLYQLPPTTRIFTLHDYQPDGRELRYESTIGEELAKNIHVSADTSREEFVELRKRLEAGKPAPTLLFPAVQVNLRAGDLPTPEKNGIAYLKVPLNALPGEGEESR